MLRESTVSISLTASDSETVQLHCDRAYSGLRMLVTGAANVKLSDIAEITVSQPSKGNLARRVNLAGTDLKWLPLICAWGAPSAEESTTASSFDPVADFTGAPADSELSKQAYFDLPVTVFPDEADIRVFVKTSANQALTINFAFLETGDASRHGAFRAYSGTTSAGTWMLPGDGQMTGLFLAEWDAATQWADRATETEIDRLSINGVEDKTFRSLTNLGVEADQYFTGQTDQWLEMSQKLVYVFYNELPTGADNFIQYSKGGAGPHTNTTHGMTVLFPTANSDGE